MTLAAYDPIAKVFVDGPYLFAGDLNRAFSDAQSGSVIGGLTGTPPIVVSAGTVSLAQSGATVGQALAWNGTAWVPTTIAGGSGGTSTPITGLTIDGSTITASTSSPYQMQTADRVVDVNKTTGAATKLLLPTNPTLWVEYTIIDGKRDAGTNNITITAANGTTINGAALAVLASNAVTISLRAVNATTWRIM